MLDVVPSLLLLQTALESDVRASLRRQRLQYDVYIRR